MGAGGGGDDRGVGRRVVGVDLEGSDVADPERRPVKTSRVGRRAADVVALVDRRAVGKERTRRHRTAVVLEGSEQRVLVDLVAGAVEAALVEAVDVVAVGGGGLAAVLEGRVAAAAADDRVLDVGDSATLGEVAATRSARRGAGGAHGAAGDRRVH